jgi:hypothetical protein
MSLERLNAIFASHFWLAAHPQHQRYVRPIHIRVEQSDFVPHLRQRHSQIHRQRRLSHSALARTYGDNGVNSREWLRAWRCLAGIMRMCIQGITLQWRDYDAKARLYKGFTQEDSLDCLNPFWNLSEEYFLARLRAKFGEQRVVGWQ